MIKIEKIILIFLFLIVSAVITACSSAQARNSYSEQQNNNFILKNTVAVYMVNDEKNSQFFCIPVQYVFEYQIQSFELADSLITIGDYEIAINKNNSNIYIYLNEETDAWGDLGIIDFNKIYIEEKGVISLSEMNKPLKAKISEDMMNYYYIFIERHLNNDELNAIINEYKKGNVSSRFEIWYDLVLDNEPQYGSGILDTFEMSVRDPAYNDPTYGIPNLMFFKTMYID